MMGPLILLALLRAIGLVRGQDNWVGTSVRPEYPAVPIQGFKAGAETTNTKGGRSDWNPFWYKDSGRVLWVDKEGEDWSNNFTNFLREYWSIAWDSDEGVVRRIFVGYNLLQMAVVIGRFFYSFVLLIGNDLERHRNSSPTCFFLVAPLALLGGIRGSIICIQTWGLMHFMQYAFQFPILGYFNYVVGVSAIDVYQVTMKTSKSSSWNLKILRRFLRIWALFFVFIFPLLSISSRNTGLYISFFAPLFLNMIIMLTFWYLMNNTRFEDEKDNVEGHNTMLVVLRGNPRLYHVHILIDWILPQTFIFTKDSEKFGIHRRESSYWFHGNRKDEKSDEKSLPTYFGAPSSDSSILV